MILCPLPRSSRGAGNIARRRSHQRSPRGAAGIALREAAQGPLTHRARLCPGFLEEGLEARYERHRRNSAALRAGFQALGLKLVAPDDFRLDQITAVWIPDGVDDLQVRQMLLSNYTIEIGRGLGDFIGKVWRIGLMGDSSKPEYVLALLAALEEILPRVEFEVPYGAGVASASRSLAMG